MPFNRTFYSHHIFGILRETLITLLGIFGSGSSSVRPLIRSSLLHQRQAKIFGIFFSSSTFLSTGLRCLPTVLFTVAFCCSSLSVFSSTCGCVRFQSTPPAFPVYSTSSLFGFSLIIGTASQFLLQ